MEKEFQVPWVVENFLTNLAAVGFSRTLLHEVTEQLTLS
jgi:hypothetical protein